MERIFNARSVAVVGASNDPRKLGYTILSNIMGGGYGGSVYPVNRKGEAVLGMRSYTSISGIPTKLDLAVVVVPSEGVINAVREAGQKGVAGAVIISSGFREIGRTDLEASLVKIAREAGMRLIGPNCQGFSYLPNNLCCSWPLLKKLGEIAVISQSGTISAAIATWAEAENLGVSCCLSLGNKCDVNEVDVIKFLASDGVTKAIAIYTEGLREGRLFMETAKQITDRVPVVVLRGGRTLRGWQAAQSHTKSLAGRYEVFSGFSQDAGLITVTTLDALYQQTKALASVKRPRGKKVLVITSSGGCGVLASDTVDEAGLQMAQIPAEIADKLKKELPPYCVLGNPVDLTGDATATLYDKVVRATSGCGQIDAYCLIFGDPLPGVADTVIGLRGNIEQGIVVAFLGGGGVERQEREIFYQARIPVFGTPESAIWALAACANHHALQAT